MHGRYTYNTCTGGGGGGGEEEGGKKEEKKVGRSEKVGIPKKKKSGQTASLIISKIKYNFVILQLIGQPHVELK